MCPVRLRNATSFNDLVSAPQVPSEPQWEKMELKGQKRGQGNIRDSSRNGDRKVAGGAGSPLAA